MTSKTAKTGEEKREPILRNLPEIVAEKVKKYDDLDLLQQCGMFLGKAQILEIGLKNVLARRFDYEHHRMERWTLGRVKNELESSGVRPDFIALLASLVELRNFVVHDLLAAEILLMDAIGETGRLNVKHLQKSIWELEQLLLIADWQEEHDAWLGG